LNYALDKNGEIKSVDDMSKSEQAMADSQVRINTISYLLRLVLSRMTGNSLMIESLYGGTFQKMAVEETFSYEYSESQSAEFSSTGTAITADGRVLEFNYSFSMSASFSEAGSETRSGNIFTLIDPLVINLDTNPAKLSDQKIYFDLDCDGVEEELNNLQANSGFLALDINGDGKINDGSELFGPKTGDGFKELSLYDEDHNGWIDENDSIFSKLKIWAIDGNGKPELYGLKKSDVGAIYLGKVTTDFIDYDGENKVRGMIRESGIYLKESTGEARGIQHVDMAT